VILNVDPTNHVNSFAVFVLFHVLDETSTSPAVKALLQTKRRNWLAYLVMDISSAPLARIDLGVALDTLLGTQVPSDFQ
jgi:hypothetical protein